MDSAATQDQAVADVLKAQPFVLAALLFGSRAAGTATAASDIDLAILPDAPLTSEQRYQLIEKIAQVVGSPIDLIDLAAEHGFVAREALTKGRLLLSQG